VWNGFSRAYLSLHPYVRRNGPEGDYHVLTPLEFHVGTSELIQMLKKGHKGVTLSAEDWDRLYTWIDLNVPYFGTWTERGASQHYIQSRREYEKRLAALDYDPEKIINPYQPGTIAFEAPKAQPQTQGTTASLAGWPFDGAKAQGTRQVITLNVGGDQKMQLVKIPAGAFIMGSNDESPAEAPAHAVMIEKPFYMGVTEVTMGMMQQFYPTFENGVYDMHYKDQVKRGYFVNDPDFPAIRVSYEKALAFCAWLSEKTGKKVRLPTEVEWEYACRAGTNTPMNYGDFNADFAPHANLADLTMKRLAVWGIDPQPIRNPDQWMDYELKDPRFYDKVLHLAKVGSYAPNAFGLKDMHGNVAEWTASPFVGYPGAAESEAYNAEHRVIRGGSWYQRQHRATSAWRWGYPTWQRPYNVGFRVVVED
jgi:formylglycine-generating enzyme required for sulfatase activity